MSELAMVLEHPCYKKTLALLETQVGRDKLMRAVQYWARFFAWYLYRQGKSKAVFGFWRALQQQLTQARKLFRMGKPLSHVALAGAAYAQKTQDPVLRACTIGRNIMYAGYLSLDAVVWFNNTRVYEFSRAKDLQRAGYRFWLAGLVFGLATSARKWQRAYQTRLALQAEAEKDTANLAKVETEIAAIQRQLLWDALDTTIPLSALELVRFDDGQVGLAGLITSVLALQDLWRRA